MFFDFRRWATKIIGEASLPIRSPEATLLIELMIFGAKKDREMMQHGIGKTLPKDDGVILAAIHMADNQSAIAEVCKVLSLSPSQGAALLDRIRQAAIHLAFKSGKIELFEFGKKVREDSFKGIKQREY